MENPIPKTNVLQMLWIGTCTVLEYLPITDPITHQTTHRLTAVAEDEPCRISFSTLSVSDVQDNVAKPVQTTKLFIRPDLEIKAGSVLEITQHGVKNRYRRSSEPAVYTNHQEVLLELYEDI